MFQEDKILSCLQVYVCEMEAPEKQPSVKIQAIFIRGILSPVEEICID